MTTTPSTPPPTELDAPSPAEQDIRHLPPSGSATPFSADMAAHRLQRPIYLVVATSVNPPLGIGNKGSLPWPQIRSDMTFFRKVTTGPTSEDGAKNAVIMGRKTWDSIPAKFRPLEGRINFVVTRAEAMATATTMLSQMEKKDQFSMGDDTSSGSEQPSMVTIKDNTDRQTKIVVTNSVNQAMDLDDPRVKVKHLFCIGGAEIYKLILESPELKNRVRVLQTQVRRLDGGEYECDTYFPEPLDHKSGGWKSVEREEVMHWISMDLPQGEAEWKDEDKNAVAIKVVGWERA